MTNKPHPANEAMTIQEFDRQMKRRTASLISEAAVQQTIIDLLLLDGWGVIRANSGGMQVDDRYVRFCTWYMSGETADTGVADLIAFKDGRVLFLETKAPGGRQRKTQEAFEAGVTAVGCTYLMIDDAAMIAPYLDRVEM